MSLFSISLSDTIDNHNICTYHGYLNFDSLDEDNIAEWIREKELPDIDLDEYWYSGDYLEMRDKFYEVVDKILNSHIRPIIEAPLKKYGYDLKSVSLWRPREYNLRGDSIDIELVFNGDEIINRQRLKDHIENYIKNVRKSSCDGYASLEPNRWIDVEFNDYAMLWAILYEEELFEQLHDTLGDDLIDEISQEYCHLSFEYLEKFCRQKNPDFFRAIDQEKFNEENTVSRIL